MSKVSTVPASDKYITIVAQVLGLAAGKMTTYFVKKYEVRPATIKTVAELVAKKTIKVRIIQGGSKFHGGYVSRDGGCILLEPWGKDKNPVAYRSTMVHEAVHASFDVLGEKQSFQMSAHDDESAAYIGQAMYLIRQGVLASEFVSYKEPVVAAHPVARELLALGEKTGSKWAMDNLMSVLTKWYKNETRLKDGVH